MDPVSDDEPEFPLRFWRAVCSVCGRERTYTADAVIEWLTHELPRCCGEELDFNPVSPPAD